MSKLWITELASLGSVNGLSTPIAALPAIASQNPTISGTSAQSSAFNAGTRFIRVHTDVTCHILVGADPTATTADLRMPADSTEYFAVPLGYKIAGITV